MDHKEHCNVGKVMLAIVKVWVCVCVCVCLNNIALGKVLHKDMT